MKKILFVCYGNICRSPMAEAVLNHLIKEKNLEDNFYVESAATSNEEIGNDIYPVAKQVLIENGITFKPRIARQLRADDYDNFDYIIGMEMYNIYAIKDIIGLDHNNKVLRLLDFTENPRDINDPWVTGLFEEAYKDIYEGCLALINQLEKIND